MDPALVPIIQGLITVAGTLGGTWLGIQLSKGKEERQWRRDRCLDAYAEVLTLSAQSSINVRIQVAGPHVILKRKSSSGQSKRNCG
jgi:hypothetical protein